MNYYNEYDKDAAAWLRNLIAAGEIPKGEVDERDIREVQPSDLRGFTQCHFFAGIGGWSLALRLAGWPDTRPVWTGSCPCQSFSLAGKQEGHGDERNLWPDWFKLIRVQRPAVCFGEQVDAAVGFGWLDGDFHDLESEVYACGAAILPACCVRAPHLRKRIWWVADAEFANRRSEFQTGSTGSGWNGSGGGSAFGGVADSARGGFGTNGISPRNAGHLNVSGADSRMAHADGGVAGDGGIQRRGLQRQQPENGGAMQLVNPNNSRRREFGGPFAMGAEFSGVERSGGNGRLADPSDSGRSKQRDGSGQRGEPRAEHASEYPGSGFWDQSDLIPCSDGKFRRVESGTFPLAHAWPDRSMGPLRAVLETMGIDPVTAKRAERNARGTLAKAGRNRTIRLRGYGNAIVPQVAAEFIKAYDEISR